MSTPAQNTTTLQAVESITQFVGGTQAVWNNITMPIPAGMVIYATDTTVVKMGDGQTLYANLPTLFILSDMASLQTSLNTLTNDVTQLTTELTNLQTQIAGSIVYSETGNVTVTSTQSFIGIANTVSAETIVTLPSIPINNEQHIIKDVLGVAQNYNITIDGNGKTIDGQTTWSIRNNYGSVTLLWNSQSWSVI